MGGTSLSVLSKVLQNALSRAYPNPLPSNQILTQTADGQAAVEVGTGATLTLTPQSDLTWGDATHTTQSRWGRGQWR